MTDRIRKTAVAVMLGVALLLSAAQSAYAFGKGASGPDVFAVQAMLKSLGYYGGSITGYYGADTADAVSRFQRRSGLRPTGAVDARTLQSILWAYGALKLPSTPAPGPSSPVPPPAPVPAPSPSPSPYASPSESPSPSPSPSPQTAGLSGEERQMLELVNAARRKAGVPPLEADEQLSRVARIKCEDMVSDDYFSHHSPTFGSPFEMLKRFGVSYRSAGENIACNQTVQAAHESLMNSAGHRENILSREFTRIGIGIVNAGPCGKMLTQQFIRP